MLSQPLEWLGIDLLSAIVFYPLAGLGVLLTLEMLSRLFGGRVSAGLWRVAGFIVSMIGLVLSVDLWQTFDPSKSGMQLVEHMPWLPDFGINYYVGVDGITLFLIVLTAFLLPVILLASWTDIASRVKQYVFFMLLLQCGMMGAFLSLNMFLFYVFWEVMLIPMYFLIGIWGGPRRIYATMKFFIYTMVGSLLMLVAILILAFLHYQEFGGVLNFDYIGWNGAKGILDTVLHTDGSIWWQNQRWLFLAFALAFAIKVPLFPFHTWLPDAHVEAPTAGSAILAGVLLKLGTYGFLRYALPLFPQATLEAAPWLIGLCLIGIVYGALVAMVQTDIKKLVAYSSVSHLGLVMLGIFVLTIQGLEGAVLQMVNHGISTGALFILVGMIYERRHTREISSFGGIAQVMPVFTVFFLITTFSSIGLPVLNGFVGEYLILLGTFTTNKPAAVIATSGVILSAVYMLWMVRRVFFGAVTSEANQKLQDLNTREKLVAVALVLPMFWIGVYPSSFLSPMHNSVSGLLLTMERKGVDIAAYTGVRIHTRVEAATEGEAPRSSGE